MSPRAFLFPAAALLVAGILWATGGRPAPPPGPPLPPPPPPPGPSTPAGRWRAQNVRLERLPRTASLPASVRSPEEVPIVCDLPEPFVEVAVREGSAVKKGDLLARVKDEPLRLALAAAEKAGDAREAGRLRGMLAAVEVRAPCDGIVFRLAAVVGERPPRGKQGPRPCVILFDWRRIAFAGSASGETATLIRGGATLYVRLPGEEGLTPGEATLVGEPGPDGAVAVVARPTSPPGRAPQPGAAGEILVVTGDREGTVVPRSAIRVEDGQAVVYLVSVTETLERRPVRVGDGIAGGWVEVTGAGITASTAVAAWEPGDGGR